MARCRVNEVQPGTSFDNPIWHKGFRICLYSNEKNPQYSYQAVGPDGVPGGASWFAAATIAGAKTKIDQLLGDAKP